MSSDGIQHVVTVDKYSPATVQRLKKKYNLSDDPDAEIIESLREHHNEPPDSVDTPQLFHESRGDK